MTGLVVLASEVTDTRPRQVYFIRSKGPAGEIKIGSAREPRARLRELQVGNPNELVLEAVEPGGSQREKELHALFAEHRIRGEWFFPAPEVRQYIARLLESRAPLPVHQIPDHLISIKGAAETLGTTSLEIRKLLKAGVLATWRLPSGTPRIDLAELTAYVEGGGS